MVTTTNAYVCEAKYQGYAGTACSYRRSDGLAPEGGEIQLNLADVGVIRIVPFHVPWRPVGGVEFDGGLDIRTWKRFQGRGTTTADRPPIPAPKGGGVAQFGDLVLRTRAYPRAELVDELTYRDVYVDSSGLEEITRELAEIREHDRGTLRVPLTDVRRYFATHGPLFARINCHLKTGPLDPDSTDEGNKPWSFVDVVEFLFSQLPSSPTVHPKSDLYVGEFDAPHGIEGQGEPAVEHLQKVLDRAGLKPQMLPDGRFAVTFKGSTRVDRGSVATDVRVVKDLDDEVSYERRTSYVTDRPPAVQVFGPRRVMRATISYVPVLKDDDGRYNHLEEVVERWGYDLDKVNRQVFNADPNRFADVPPDVERDPKLHDRRREELKNAYRTYLPAFLAGLQGRTFAEGVAAFDLETNPPDLLPYVDAPWYLTEMQKIKDAPPIAHGGKGDLEDYRLLPPVVRGQRVGAMTFKDFKALRKQFDVRTQVLQDEKRANESLVNEYRTKARDATFDLLRAEAVAPGTLNAADQTRLGVRIFEGVVAIDADQTLALSTLRSVMAKSDREAAVRNAPAQARLAEQYRLIAELFVDSQAKHDKLAAAWQEKFDEFERIYKNKGVLPCRYNLPQGVLPAGLARVDRATGLLESSVPLCQVRQPAFFDGDQVEVLADGGVSVTTAFELKGSLLNAYTNFVFVGVLPSEGDIETSVPEVKFAGSSRSTPIKARSVMMEARMYLLDNGTPVNYNETWAEAKTKATALLAVPATATGYVTEFLGLRKCVLDAGITSVQHEWDGSVGMTHVAINAPGGQMPRGPGNLVGRRATPHADAREALQREGGPT